MKVRPLYPILAIAAVAHASLFWSLRDVPLLSYAKGRPAEEQTDTFFTEEALVSATSPEGDLVTEKRFTVPSQILTPVTTLSLPRPNIWPQAWSNSLDAAPPPTLPGVVGAAQAPNVALFQLQTNAQRVVYLIDASGSMYLPRTASRLSAARQAVATSILNLPADVQFNIVFFAASTAPWKDAPVYASTIAKAEALRFLQQEPDLRAATDLLGGLRAGLQMKPDSLFVLTDGGAQGATWSLLTQARYFRKKFAPLAKVYAVGFDTAQEGDDEMLLKKLSAQNGGEYWAYHSPAEEKSVKR